MTTSADVRVQLLEAMRLDLVGPRPGHPPHAAYFEEVLPVSPSRWYLTGFLVPHEAPLPQRSDDDEDEILEVQEPPTHTDDDSPPEGASARKGHFPSSMGLSVLVSADTAQLFVRVAWADYVPSERQDPSAPDAAAPPEPERAGGGFWRRIPREAEKVIALGQPGVFSAAVPGAPRLQLVVSERSLPPAGALPAGTRSVSVFLVNHRSPRADHTRDVGSVFQPELSVRVLQSLIARPDLRGQHTSDLDDRIADLQYRDAAEYVVGHNVSAVAERDSAGRCRHVRSAWLPFATVEKVVAAPLNGVTLDMARLATAESATDLQAMVGPMVTRYAEWLQRQRATAIEGSQRQAVAEQLLESAERTRLRIQAGLDTLSDPQVLEAFRITNRVIAQAIRQRLSHDRKDTQPADVAPPQWRPFQLAFILMNLEGIVHPEHGDRAVVDLLFFPTGGGKTEAYLGLAAFTLLLRRLRTPTVQSAGVSVLMRYTLRLLTLDQLARAATLICALELERQADVSTLGPWPFEIGLWVGQAATPNTMGKKGDRKDHTARARTIAFQNDSKLKPSPIPLESCPWCGAKFDKHSFKLVPDPNAPLELRVSCIRRECRFHVRRQRAGLPILAVDEPIYRRLPCFIVATVDKFANLPWVGSTGALFGKVSRHDPNGFYGPADSPQGKPLDGPLPPPDLVIQDELHLISGPLGTMVGLYETAIDALSSHTVDGVTIKPKIVASTATVRRAERQIQGLFGRTGVAIFPPPGPNRRDSFFARTAPVTERNPRTYLGVAAPGRSAKVALLRVYLALMSAGQKAWQEAGGARNLENPADPYMTLLGYFGSLRELGGSRRIVEDEVTTRLADYGRRRLRVGERRGLFANRTRVTEPRELTSRVGTHLVADTKRRLALSFHDKERVDVVLATNMISVGLDITRLGLMVVLGQPKLTSEYIQATSRVGRDDERPGLVVVLLNTARPRDRSHFERFASWHESFYRAVEATSVTPFSPRAIDRGIAGVTVALARLGHEGLTAPRGALEIMRLRSELGFVAETLSRRAERHDAALDRAQSERLRQDVRDRVQGLLDAWAHIATQKGDLQYQREVGVAPPLLFDPLDAELSHQTAEAQQFTAHRSLRDVEPSVNLWLRTPDGVALYEEDV